MTTEPPEVPERGRRSRRLLDRLRARLQAWHVGLVAGILAAVAIAGYLWLSGGDSISQTTDPPQGQDAKQGVACPHLHEAFTHSQAGNEEALQQSVAAAARAGEQALQQSGQEFGRPEEIAIELQYAISNGDGGPTGVSQLLENARLACVRLGQWQPAS